MDSRKEKIKNLMHSGDMQLCIKECKFALFAEAVMIIAIIGVLIKEYIDYGEIDMTALTFAGAGLLILTAFVVVISGVFILFDIISIFSKVDSYIFTTGELRGPGTLERDPRSYYIRRGRNHFLVGVEKDPDHIIWAYSRAIYKCDEIYQSMGAKAEIAYNEDTKRAIIFRKI